MTDVVLQPDQSAVGRRALLLAAAGAGAAAATATSLATAAPAQAAPPTTGSYYVHKTQAWLLAQRATGGATPALVASISRLGAAKWLDYQLNPTRLSDATFERTATRFAKQSMPIWQVRSLLDEGKLKGWEHKFQIQCEHVARLCWSSRQLQAVMTDFWTNHLNVAVMSDGVDESRAHYQYTVRSKALGKYSDLLLAASQHPAMLTFLDNRSSRAAHPNENQGRELLELHTLGVGQLLRDRRAEQHPGAHRPQRRERVRRVRVQALVPLDRPGQGPRLEEHEQHPHLRPRRGPLDADLPGAPPGDRPAGVHQAGPVLRRRDPAARAGLAHGHHLPQERHGHRARCCG